MDVKETTISSRSWAYSILSLILSLRKNTIDDMEVLVFCGHDEVMLRVANELHFVKHKILKEET